VLSESEEENNETSDLNNQDENGDVVSKKTAKHVALEEVLNTGARIKKKIDDIDGILSNNSKVAHTYQVHNFFRYYIYILKD
jgi:hypothetical protein